MTNRYSEHDHEHDPAARPASLLILGASGDLAARLLMPGLGGLLAHEPHRRVQLVGAGVETYTDDEWKDRVRTSLASVDASGPAIDDLLELSTIEGSGLPSREPVPVHHVVAEAVDRIRPAAELGKVEIEVHQPPGPLVVVGDRRQLVPVVVERRVDVDRDSHRPLG